MVGHGGRTRKQKSVELSLELKRLLLIRRKPEDLSTTWPRQVGGGTITQNGFRYNYREFPKENVIEIYGGGKGGRKQCFFMMINPDKTAVLQGLKAGSECSLDGGATTKNMLKAAFQLAKEKGATMIELDDNAKKYIDGHRYFYLSDMYFLTTGKTWYESADVGIHPAPEQTVLVEKWRGYARTNTWAFVASRLDLSLPIDISDIDVNAPGSAMVVFNRMKEAGTDFFVMYNGELLPASNIGALGQIRWVADLAAY